MKQRKSTCIVFVITCFLCSNVWAQIVYPDDQLYWKRYRTSMNNSYAYNMPVSYDKQVSYIKERHITSVTQQKQSFNKNGKAKKVRWYNVFEYDTAGRCTSLSGGRASKSISWANQYDYNDKGYMYKVVSINKKGKITQTSQHDYDTVGLIHFHYYEINKKGDTTTQTKRGRKDTINLTSTDYYYKNGKLKYTWLNEYYQDKSAKQTTLYKNNKQKYVWNFQCKEEGLELTKQKDTSMVCTSKTYNTDSTVTEVYLTTDAKGVAYKTVIVLNKKGAIMNIAKTNEKEGWLVYDHKNTYTADAKTWTGVTYSSYDKGVLSHINTTQLDIEGNITAKTASTYKKGVLESSTTESYDYDNQNRPTLKKILLADGTPKEITEFTYK